MEVTGEMQVNIAHRNDLSISAARSAAFHAKAGAEARFTQTNYRVFADRIHCIGKSHGRSRLAFTRGRRGNGGHEDQFAVRLLSV